MTVRELLVIIPARGGSKGIPGKNIKPLGGRPLLHYAIDTARVLCDDADICLTTDSPQIAAAAVDAGLPVPFLRPDELARDTSGTYEVLLHALDHYRAGGIEYRHVLLLQPTSPFRTAAEVRAAYRTYLEELPELLVSVRVSDANPYYNLFEEDAEGFLRKSKASDVTSRQEAPTVYAFTGAFYFTSSPHLRARPFHRMTRVRKFVTAERSSLDLDTPLQWRFAEFLLKQDASATAK